ncbi:MAG: hypothetical protein QM811_10430 [Pirellulales bacterium]
MLLPLANALSGQRIKPWSLRTALLVVTLAIGCATAISVWIAAGRFGETAYGSGALAGGIVWIAGVAALCLMAIGRTPQTGATLAMAGMLVRMALPLAALALVPKTWPEIAAAGFAGQLVALFLVMLVVEVYASLRVAAGKQAPQPNGGPTGTLDSTNASKTTTD